MNIHMTPVDMPKFEGLTIDRLATCFAVPIGSASRASGTYVCGEQKYVLAILTLKIQMDGSITHLKLYIPADDAARLENRQMDDPLFTNILKQALSNAYGEVIPIVPNDNGTIAVEGDGPCFYYESGLTGAKHYFWVVRNPEPPAKNWGVKRQPHGDRKLFGV